MSADSWITQSLTCWREDRPLPLLSEIEPNISDEDAYAIQARLLEQAGFGVYGYKSALTTEAVQRHYDLDAPISGVLLSGREITAPASLVQAPGVKLETEIGFVLSEAIHAPVEPDSVLQQIAWVAPVIEVARPYLDGRPAAADLIASNAASHRFIVGEQQRSDDLSIDDIRVELARDGQPLHGALAGTVLSGQLIAVSWLINHLLALGRPLLPDQLLITGAVGDMHDAEPGDYFASYAGLGEIAFTVEAA